MNTSAAVLALSLALAMSFATPATAVTGNTDQAALVVSCAAGSRLSLGATAALIGSNNAQQVYTARSRLMAQVRSACHRAGVAQVTVVRGASESRLAVKPARAAAGTIAGN